MATLYVLHFDKPVWGTCRHYIGYTELPVEKRVEQHRKGVGSRICRKAGKLGIEFHLVYTEQFANYREARKREREVKRKGKVAGGLCPLCK